MKKTNWKDSLKLWLSALLFYVASAVTGCGKLRTLPKRALAHCLALAMIVAVLPVNILRANAEEPSSALPGARVETNSYGDVFLGGNYIEMGISKHGSFGTYASPKTSGWHKQSGLSGIGFRSDEDGWDVGKEPVTGDFFLPGSAEERWILSYKLGGITYEHLVADRYYGSLGSWLEEPKTENASDLGSGSLKAVVTGITSKNVKIEITYTFGVNDLFYTTSVKVTNLGDAEIQDVRFARSFDPDQDQYNYGSYETYNKVICNPDSAKPASDTNYAMVVARGSRSLAGFFFLAFDNRARVSRGVDFAPDSAYMDGLWDTAPVTEKTFATDASIEITSENRNGYTLEDSAIALTFHIGTMAGGASSDLQYYSSLDPDVMNSLKNVLAGNVDYTEEVLTGLNAGASYQITYDGVTYIFKNIPKSTIPLVGTAPTTADSTSAVAYDFLGKTITVEEVNASGETVSEKQELTIASRPGEMKPGEILPDVPAPVIENITTTLNGITIDPAVAIQEYSLDGKTWISPTDGKVIFTGLEDGTGYTVYTRVAATSEYPASQICSLLVYTDSYKVTLNYGTLGREEEVYAQASGKLDLPHPVFDGYIFMGWYKDAGFNDPFDFDTPVAGDTTIYAKFDVAVTQIEKTKTEGLVDTYTITYTDGTTTTFTVTNGEKGEQGIQGVPGKDGHTPVIEIKDGYWYIDGVNTNQLAQGPQGEKGEQGEVGPQGPQGEQGATGNGIGKIEKTGTAGLVDTYTITYTDGATTTFTVTNGEKGEKGEQGIQGVPGKDGHTPVIEIKDGYWYIDGVNTNQLAQGPQGEKGEQGEVGPQGPQGEQGATGNGIGKIEKTGTAGLVDTYTITYTNGATTTFTVTNGEKGEQGIQGIQGIQGVPGKDGHTPVIEIKDGYWHIDGANTNILAAGIQGEAGKDGITPQLRISSDNVWEVSYDNGATWESLGISAVGQNGTNGTNGITPKLRVNDKNIWEVSYDGGNTWESLGISAVGTNGTNGTNGKDGANGKNGAEGKDGADGKDGITPKLRINSETNMWEVSYDGGKTWESLGVSATGATGADGKDGVTPQLRINGDTNMWEVSYDGGATWTSMGVVATGADGKDGSSALPIVISGISLAGMAVMFVMMMSDRKKRAFAGRH